MIASFEAVARLGSRADAAAELNVTLGAVTKQLRALEQWLGVTLFDGDLRSGAAMTAEGRRLAMAVTAGFDTIKNGIGEIAVVEGAPIELHILAPAGLSVNWLLPSLPKLEQEAPRLRLRVHTTHTGEDWVRTRHDAAIRRDAFVPEGYSREVLFQERLGAYVAAALPVTCSLERDLESLPLIESRTRSGDLDRWLAAAGTNKIAMPRKRFSHFYTAYEAAIAAEGIIIAPTILAFGDIAQGRLKAFYPEVLISGAQNSLLFAVNNENAEAVSVLLSFLRRKIAETEFSIGRL